MTREQAVELLHHAHDYLYASRRVNHHFMGNSFDYACHNMAHTVLFLSRQQVELEIKSSVSSDYSNL